MKIMIIPVNGHLIVKPKENKTFLPTEKGTFQEIGEVVAIAEDLKNLFQGFDKKGEDAVKIGVDVYFDSWLSAKYPTGEGDEEFYLVPWKDVRAIKRKEKNETDEISK